MCTPTEPLPPASLADVPGWLFPRDQALMTWLLDRQQQEAPGDLVELGVFQGRSAIVLGTRLRPGETFTVLDLFGDSIEDAAVRSEQNRSYANLTRAAFERNYLAFHPELPTIVQAPSSAIVEHVKPASCRFIHVDASHMYEHVAADIENARTLLQPDGVVVCDDFRSEHTPGVAAAVWSAVAAGDLRPIAVTGHKFYGTWGDADHVQDELVEWLESHQPGVSDVQQILGRRLVRIRPWTDPPLADVRPLNPPPAPARATSRGPLWRSVARELLPPVVTRAIRRARSH